MRKQQKKAVIPSIEQIEQERRRVRYASAYRATLRSTVFTLVVVAAIAILVATMWLPFLRIYGTSMTPTLDDGQIVCCVKTEDFRSGEVIAFYYNNKILVKRVIGQAGDWIDMDREGAISVNGIPLDEPYLKEKSFGDSDLAYPYQVPEGKIFVAGDHRETSLDSRHTAVGCVAQEQVVGRVLIRLWPLNAIAVF